MTDLLKFFVLTFVAAWICFIGAAAIPADTASPFSALAPFRGVLFTLGAITPSLVTLTLIDRSEGRAGMVAFLRGLFKRRAAPGWYLFAAFYMVAVKLTVALIHRVVTRGWPRFGDEAWYVMAGAVLISTWVQAGEEIGWRGYALPRMSERLGLSRASLLLGVIWAAWHLPFFFISQADTFGESFPVYVLQVTALSVTVAWLYWRTQNLLPVILLHAAVNNTKDIVPSGATPGVNVFALSNSLVAWLTLALLWIAAAYSLGRVWIVNALNRSNSVLPH